MMRSHTSDKNPRPVTCDFIIQAQGFPAEIKDSIKLPNYTKAALPNETVFNDVVKWLQDKALIKGSYEYKALVDELVLGL